MGTYIDTAISSSTSGVVRVSDIVAHGGCRQSVRKYVDNNALFRVGRGLYQITSKWEDELYILSQKYSKGIVSNETALFLHGFTDKTPHSYTFTFPQGYNAASLKQENVVVRKVIASNYGLGVTSGFTPMNNPVKMYDLERTLCDIVRGEGSDIQIINDAMKRYVKYKGKNINLLFKYADKLRVKKKIYRYMEVLL